MAELCRKCFIEICRPCTDDISWLEDDIVMSEDVTLCEGCGEVLPYVHHLGKELTCKECDELASHIADIFAELGNP